MPPAEDRMNFCWVDKQLDSIRFLSLEQDPDLDLKDIATDYKSEIHEKLMKSYYLEEDRHTRASNTLDRVRDLMGLVAPHSFQESLLNTLLEYEWLAHAKIKVAEGSDSPKLYRDHLLHPAAVCAIGWWMMKSGKLPVLGMENIAKILRDKYNILYPGMDWKDITLRAWVIASLTHDLLYPVEFILQLKEPIAYNSHLISKSRIVLSHAEQIRNETTMKIFKRIVNKKILKETLKGKHIHSVLGALYLLDSHDDYRSTTLRRKIILELAASAIFFHHTSDKERICFKKNPLGCLLALADNCHEFGREYLIWSTKDEKRILEFIPPITHAYIEKISHNGYCLHLVWNDPDKMDILKKEQNGFDPDTFIKDKNKFFALFKNPADHGFTFDMQTD